MDGSFGWNLQDLHESYVGYVLFSWPDNFVLAGGERVNGRDPEHTEALAIKSGLSLGIDMGWKNVVICSDNLNIVATCKGIESSTSVLTYALNYSLFVIYQGS
ncbi:hypothetical protein AQUCO_00600351v1 [Aquilegia coerulea]|uniref:RNase H type-1 domain-containing protein n=1 Tax=Aquilegia coerulea TaxID=218851 RepID=A0A2G5EPB9_AQUCA|nr:hypothetical protein AQUCO_00600351v1 [Aquilegia coerulea]